jgi:hypothetical protein
MKRWFPMRGPRPRTFDEIVAAQDLLEVAGGERFVDPTINSFHAEVSVNEDRDGTGEWRVEYFDKHGGCYVTIFAGPEAALRARAYFPSAQGQVTEDHSRVCNALSEAPQCLRCPRLKSIAIAPRSASGKPKGAVLRPTKTRLTMAEEWLRMAQQEVQLTGRR